MKIKSRIFLGFFLIIGIGFSLLLWWILNDLDPQYRKVTEEPLIDTSRVLASFAATTAKDGQVDIDMFRSVFDDVYSRSFSAEIYESDIYNSQPYGFKKEDVDYRVYITDRNGIVTFDSRGAQAVGEDYSRWRDVYLTLRGRYGARTSHEDPLNPHASVMYVASPIVSGDDIIGVLTVGKPTKTVNSFVDSTKTRIILAGLTIFLSVILISMLIARMITRPLRKLDEYARAVRDGKRVTLPDLGNSEVKDLGITFEEMRDALEGKHYVEKYVQTLTHEIKSPVSAIRGAAELLKEEMPSGQRNIFLDNIQGESERINRVVEKLLLLSSLESRKAPPEKSRVNLSHVASDVIENMLPLFKSKDINLEIAGIKECYIEGDPFLVRHAIVNLLQNAVDFSPHGGTITVALSRGDNHETAFSVTDNGPGVPDYALEKVWERFYSLARPDTGKKSSGLGLSLVKEVAAHHGGDIQLKNSPTGGAVAILTFRSADIHVLH